MQNGSHHLVGRTVREVIADGRTNTLIVATQWPQLDALASLACWWSRDGGIRGWFS